MTTREIYEHIVANDITDEVIAAAEEKIASLDASNAKRAAKNAEKAAARAEEKAPIINALFAALGSEPMTAADMIAAAGVDVKPASVPSLMKGLVADGSVVKSDIKVQGKGTVRGYSRA